MNRYEDNPVSELLDYMVEICLGMDQKADSQEWEALDIRLIEIKKEIMSRVTPFFRR